MDDCERFTSIRNEDPGRSMLIELLTLMLTSAMEVDRSGIDFRASSTRDGRSLRGRDLRKMITSKKLTGNMIRLAAIPMKI